MAIFNYKKREISAKIVFYGPALCGKTTNVQYIHEKLNPKQRGELVSLATDADRTLFFDFLPIELENVGGFKTRFQIYTVPGQVYYNSTRKAVLTGVDGVIFVADSQTSMKEENIESFNNLIENLKYYNRDITQLPLILQYNKRDLDDVMTVEELNQLFNQPNLLTFSASAVTGTGVLQTLTACCKQVLQDLKNKSKRTEQAPSRKAAVIPVTQPTRITTPASETPATPPKTLTPEPVPIKLAVEKNSPQTEADNLPPSVPIPPKPEIKQPETKQPELKTELFVPEIAEVGKVQLLDPHTVTVPLRIATDSDGKNLLNIEISLSIKDFCKTVET